MRVQHNIMAMGAYRNYTNNVSAMKKNLERLSSGYKINRAGDDAAGLAISEKMRAQITGLETAQKNAKDGISLVQTAEGALTEVHDMLNRMVELATMSANGTYDNTTDRVQLQKEMNQLRDEINRIADGANFNGIQLLDGSMDSAVKVSNATALTSAQLSVLADGQLGNDPQAGIYVVDFSNTTIVSNDAAATFNLQIFGTALEITLGNTGVSLSGAELAAKIANAWNSATAADYKGKWNDNFGFTMNAEVEGTKVVFKMSGAPTAEWTQGDTAVNIIGGTAVSWNNGEEINVTVRQEAISSDKVRMYGQAKFTIGSTGLELEDGLAITIGDETYVFALTSKSLYKDAANVIDLTEFEDGTDTNAIKMAAQRLTKVAENNKTFKVGCELNSGAITLTEREGAVDYTKNNLSGGDNVGSKGNNAGNHAATTANTKLATAADWEGLVMVGKGSISGNGLTLQIGDTADSYNQLKVSISDCHTKAIGIDGISIADQTSAQTAVDAIKAAINYVSDVRGTLGATQNRLDHTINNLSVMTENIQDAESTIRDTDIAEEMMAYTKNNILIQASQAMLAQANQVPQGVLQLLQ